MAVDEKYLNSKITDRVISAAINVHKAIGPGFAEKVYERALIHEFDKNKVCYEKQKSFQITYDGVVVGEYRPDLLVEDTVIVELKTVAEINDAHLAQLLSYLKVIKKKVGLILNFAQKRLVIKRVIR